MGGKDKQLVTSLRVDPELWREAKIEAIKRGTTLANLIDKALRSEIDKKRKKLSNNVVQ